MKKLYPSEFIQIRRSLLERTIAEIRANYPNNELSDNQKNSNARDFVACAVGLLANSEPEISSTLAAVIGMKPLD
ncbi:hypothetical protein [Solimicrobium silvestre]|uniref:Uncharacterized protein n=1 Tax=Solimicrobium silvestre TaxID=2099400 RepID=A0A2S9GZA7_9BURK|nr:hypothetical protein [Solimicrobium silvestre]PRC93069.1 hypothetical protein S2091_2155 [Solimicrobium silvestre]